MKIILAVLISCALAAYVEHSYTMGLPWKDADYTDLDYMGFGDVGVGVLFTTDHLVDITNWYDPDENEGWEKSFDSFFDDELNNFYIQFEIYYSDNINSDDWTDAKYDMTRCLVCMNVDENSELREGDKGFAACYKPFTGSFFDIGDFNFNGATTVTLNYDKPEWVFLGEVKAVNKGEAVKATGKNGWLETTTWNKHKDDFTTHCSTSIGAGITGDTYYMFPYHDSKIDYWYGNGDTDYIGLVSEDGFKNTGLKDGENHLKCWVKSNDDTSFYHSQYYNADWKPDFEGDKG